MIQAEALETPFPRGEAAPEAPSGASGAALPRGIGRGAEPPSES